MAEWWRWRWWTFEVTSSTRVNPPFLGLDAPLHTTMSSPRSLPTSKLSGGSSSSSSSRTVKPRDYTSLAEPSSSNGRPPALTGPTSLTSRADELQSRTSLEPFKIDDLPEALYVIKRLVDDGAHTTGPRRRRRRANDRAREDARVVVKTVMDLLSRHDEQEDDETDEELARVLIAQWPIGEDRKGTLSGELGLSSRLQRVHRLLTDLTFVRSCYSSGPPPRPISLQSTSPKPSITHRHRRDPLVYRRTFTISISPLAFSPRLARSTLHTLVSLRPASLRSSDRPSDR